MCPMNDGGTGPLDDERYNGAFNATAPTPVRNADFSHALGRALHRPAIAPVPAFALRTLYVSPSEGAHTKTFDTEELQNADSQISCCRCVSGHRRGRQPGPRAVHEKPGRSRGMLRNECPENRTARSSSWP